ncbi:MAG: hypothetical protein ABW178_05740 [Pseudoxanthomonas sp.]
MRELVLLAVLLGAAGLAGWLWFGRDTLTEEDVRAFYAQTDEAGRELDSARVCGMMTEDYVSEGTIWVEGHAKEESRKREDICRDLGELFRRMQQLRDMSGGRFKPDSSSTIVSIDVAHDGKQAVVKTRSLLRLGGLSTSSRSTDTLVRVRGKVLIKHSKGINWVGVAS